MNNTVTFSKMVVKTYELTYTDFCAMDNYKNLNDNEKLEAWQKLLKMSKLGEIYLDKLARDMDMVIGRCWQPHEETAWDEDEQQDIVNFIQKSIS